MAEPQAVEKIVRPLVCKINDLDFEVARQPGSKNFRLYFEDGSSQTLSDVNTILLWEILKALSK